jgi:hypothetical protein
MSRVHAPLLAFNRGEVSKRALARVDVERMRLAAECVVNWQPAVDGSMSLRAGTEFMFSTRSDAACQPIPFVFGKDDTALLEITESLRVIDSDALVTRASVSTTVTNGDFSSSTGWTLAATDGCTANINSTVAGSLYLAATARGGIVSCLRSVSVAGGDQATAHAFRIAVTRGPLIFMVGTTSGGSELIGRTELGTGTHSLVCTPGTGTIYVKFESRDRRGKIVDSITVESAGTFEMTAPWAAADISKLRTDQSGDIVFVACDGYQQRKIERRDNNSWSIVNYQSDNGPFSFVETNGVTLTPSVYEGDGTLDASVPMFLSSDVGKMFRIFSAGQTNQAILGAAGEVSEAIRVSGVGTSDRAFSYVRAGTWSGTIALERSIEGADTGFKEVATQTGNGTTSFDDSASHNNVVAWYRMRFKTYTSGAATVSFTGWTVGSITIGSAAAVSGRAGICRITGYTSPTQVLIEVLEAFSEVTASSDWQPGDWNNADGWPTEVKFHEGRLCWFRGDRRWGSASDQYYNFQIDGEGDSAPFNRSFGAGPVQRINWALSLTRLIVGRDMSIDPIRSSSFEEPLTATNNTAKSASTKGAANLPAAKVDGRAIYVEKSGRRIYELVYSVEIGDYRPRDLTRLTPDIGLPGFVGVTVEEQPDTTIHFTRSDGEVAQLLYEPGDEVVCWSRFMTLGVVEHVVTLPGDDEDNRYYVIKRTINGSTKRFWEKLATRAQCAGGTLNRQLDCFKAISQASSATITGLSHLEGETVGIWANGKDLGTATVTGGSATASEAVTTAIVGLTGTSFTYDSSTAAASVTALAKYNGYPAEVFANAATGGELRYVGTVTVAAGIITLPNNRTAKKIIAYLGYKAPFCSAKLAYGAQMGTALTQNKKVDKVGLVAFDFHYQGLQYGSKIDNLQPLPLVEGGQDTPADTVWSEFDRPMIGLSDSFDADSRLHLLAAAPRPVTLSAAVVAVTTNG